MFQLWMPQMSQCTHPQGEGAITCWNPFFSDVFQISSTVHLQKLMNSPSVYVLPNQLFGYLLTFSLKYQNLCKKNLLSILNQIHSGIHSD